MEVSSSLLKIMNVRTNFGPYRKHCSAASALSHDHDAARSYFTLTQVTYTKYNHFKINYPASEFYTN